MRDLTAHGSEVAIGAGGIVPLGARVPADQRTTPVTARAYTHPALAGKTIVRLEPDAVARGTDAEMAAFGFDAPVVSEPLGLVRYRTLGFPAWALIHEPKNAKAALDVTDAFRQAKRLVLAKPGQAKDAFEDIAKQLQRTAPQFLPSFWEEAGRVVADQASSTMAAQCFERARQAERAYKLKTNADDSDAVFVEFALLGALSAKTLSAYAKELARTAGGTDAYRRYRADHHQARARRHAAVLGMARICARSPGRGREPGRRGGPARRGADRGTRVGKAPVEFWATYRGRLVRIARRRGGPRTLRAICPRRVAGRTRPRPRSGGRGRALGEVARSDDLPTTDSARGCRG